MVILEIDNLCHAGGGQYSPESERKKNDGNFAASLGFHKVLFIRINPSGQYMTSEGQENIDKKARWLVMRDWVTTFLRYPYGTWTFPDQTLLYLFYSHNSPLIDRRPTVFSIVVAYRAPALPEPHNPDLADWACCMDPYLICKGSKLAQKHLALDKRLNQTSSTA